ncbi:MAG: EAL domain-containing protein [Clostridia bacterium]
MVFQPIVDVTNGEVIGYEALGRLQGREDALYDDVKALTCGHGALVSAENELLDIALDAGQARPTGTMLFVNVNQRLSRLLAEQVRREQVDLSHVVLEITETDANPEVWAAILSPLRQAGARIALDDYGVGLEDLARLVKLRPEYVKLAGAVLSLTGRDSFADRTLDALIHQANISGFVLIVEQVEDAAVLVRLRRAGIRYAQGFLLGRPAREWPLSVALPFASPIALTDPRRQAWARGAGIGEADLALLAAHRALIEEVVDSVAADFPAWLASTSARGGAERQPMYPRHSALVRVYLQRLLRGILDDTADLAAQEVARTHLRVNVDLSWYALAYGWLKTALTAELARRGALDLVDSVLRLMTYDQAASLAVYQESLDYDVLTQVLTRRAFCNRATQALSEALADGRALAFVLLDLDGFQQINDVHGHLTGDEVLQTVGTALRQRAAPDLLVGRVGGDEFGLLLPYRGDRQLRQAVAVFTEGVRQSFPDLRAAWGEALLGRDGSTFDALYGHADAALYRRRLGSESRQTRRLAKR